jgi:hypothetical protein
MAEAASMNDAQAAAVGPGHERHLPKRIDVVEGA